MTAEQMKNIEATWAKVRSTRERLSRAAEAIKSAGLAQTPDERLKELDRLYQDAVDADAAALDEVEAALRTAGINV